MCVFFSNLVKYFQLSLKYLPVFAPTEVPNGLFSLEKLRLTAPLWYLCLLQPAWNASQSVAGPQVITTVQHQDLRYQPGNALLPDVGAAWDSRLSWPHDWRGPTHATHTAPQWALSFSMHVAVLPGFALSLFVSSLSTRGPPQIDCCHNFCTVPDETTEHEELVSALWLLPWDQKVVGFSRFISGRSFVNGHARRVKWKSVQQTQGSLRGVFLLLFLNAPHWMKADMYAVSPHRIS